MTKTRAETPDHLPNHPVIPGTLQGRAETHLKVPHKKQSAFQPIRNTGPPFTTDTGLRLAD